MGLSSRNRPPRWPSVVRAVQPARPDGSSSSARSLRKIDITDRCFACTAGREDLGQLSRPDSWVCHSALPDASARPCAHGQHHREHHGRAAGPAWVGRPPLRHGAPRAEPRVVQSGGLRGRQRGGSDVVGPRRLGLESPGLGVDDGVDGGVLALVIWALVALVRAASGPGRGRTSARDSSTSGWRDRRRGIPATRRASRTPLAGAGTGLWSRASRTTAPVLGRLAQSL
jgi:hypothetical protein